MLVQDRSGAELAIPLGMLSDLVATRSAQDILDWMSKWSGRLLDAGHCVVALNDGPDALRVTSFFGADISGNDVVIPLHGSFLGTAALNLRTNYLRNIAASNHPLRDRFVAAGIDTLIITPILAEGQCFGTFGVGLGTDGENLSEVTVFFETLARCLANQLLIIDQMEQLNRMSRIDPLTGSFNRRHLAQRGTELWQAWEESGQPFGLIVVDLDHFKRINDGFGHDAGDAVLRSVVRRMNRALRADDGVIRLGGEEFCLLIADATRASARQISRRVWKTLRSTPVQVAETTIPVTCSIGYAVVSPADRSYESVLQRADSGLYRAKDSGRDQVRAGPSQLEAFA